MFTQCSHIYVHFSCSALPSEGAELCTDCWHNGVKRWHNDMRCVAKARVVYKVRDSQGPNVGIKTSLIMTSLQVFIMNFYVDVIMMRFILNPFDRELTLVKQYFWLFAAIAGLEELRQQQKVAGWVTVQERQRDVGHVQHVLQRTRWLLLDMGGRLQPVSCFRGRIVIIDCFLTLRLQVCRETEYGT